MRRRNALLAKVEEGREVRFEDWRWKVKYQSPRADEGRWKDWGSVGEVMGGRREGSGLEVGFRGGIGVVDAVETCCLHKRHRA